MLMPSGPVELLFFLFRMADDISDVVSINVVLGSLLTCLSIFLFVLERRMQPARGRFARFDLDRQIASTFPAHWKVGPAPVFQVCLVSVIN